MPEDPPKEKHDHKKLEFPDGFLWGAATSSHQVEGNNINNDWWHWELKKQPPQLRSGKADDQYHLYEQDFDLAELFNHNAHRLSIEWSRIEPEEGVWNQDAVDHYIEVLKSLKERNMVVMLTLWHFTIPLWADKKGGWENKHVAKKFVKFVEKLIPQIDKYVDLYISLNEPGVYVYMSYLNNVKKKRADFTGDPWPIQQKVSKWAAIKAFLNFSFAHKKIYKIIHKYNKHAKVGISQNVISYSNQQSHSVLQHILVWVYDIFTNHLFFILTGKKTHDFLGINYYFHQSIGSHNGSKFPRLLSAALAKKDVTDMGWEIYPEGIYNVLQDFADYKKPIYITENGLASTNDDRRCRFLISYLKEIYHAIVAKIEIKGYFHWSLIDNFEWAEGFAPRFGLIEVDYATQKRKARPSAYIYSEIIKENGIPHPLMRFIGHTVKAEEVLCYRHNGPTALCGHKHNNCPDCKI